MVCVAQPLIFQFQTLIDKEAKRLNRPTALTRLAQAMKPKDIFGLAVRLLGLFFLYMGLRAVSPVLDLEAIENAGKSDLINAILPIVFNLVIAWWLLGGGLLVRRAYPEAPKISNHSSLQAEQGTPAANPTQPQEFSDMDRAEKKLAALVEKPKDDPAFS
jgi:hypothetical protein